jgi:hypothetical protein
MRTQEDSLSYRTHNARSKGSPRFGGNLSSQSSTTRGWSAEDLPRAEEGFLSIAEAERERPAATVSDRLCFLGRIMCSRLSGSTVGRLLCHRGFTRQKGLSGGAKRRVLRRPYGLCSPEQSALAGWYSPKRWARTPCSLRYTLGLRLGS